LSLGVAQRSLPMSGAELTAIPMREATATDAPALAVLRYRFRSAIGTAVEGESAFGDRAAARLRGRIGRLAWGPGVAEAAGDRIVGNIFLQLVEKLPNPVVEAEAIGYITNLYVVPEYRRQGIGRRLLHAALAACAPGEVDTLILWPTPESVALYRKD